MISEVEPNSVTIMSVLSSCIDHANLPQGKCLHAYVTRRDSYFGFNLSFANAFIMMYARCGGMQSAKNIFETLPRRNIIARNAMINGYCMHGRGYDAIHSFLQMLEDGYTPKWSDIFIYYIFLQPFWFYREGIGAFSFHGVGF